MCILNASHMFHTTNVVQILKLPVKVHLLSGAKHGRSPTRDKQLGPQHVFQFCLLCGTALHYYAEKVCSLSFAR